VLTSGEGLPVRIRRVEDVGRHRLVRAEAAGQALNIVVPEGLPISADMSHVSFVADRINVYADDWRVQGQPAGKAA
jgi:glycerol transport system ATP-binding protein